MQEEFGSHCKVLQEDLQTYQQQPQNFLKHQKQECGYNPRYKTDNQTGQFGNQRAVNVVGARETVGGIAVYGTGDSNVIPDSPDMCDNDIQNDQHDVECDDERVALANLIANLKLDVDDNKKIQKQLKKANQH
ncbi:hypothetical protein Tco_1040386 [Tanacetum coccineum]